MPECEQFGAGMAVDAAQHQIATQKDRPSGDGLSVLGGYRLDVPESAGAAELDRRAADVVDRGSISGAEDDAGNKQPVCSGKK